MIVELVNSSQSAWREHNVRPLKPMDAPAPMASFNHPDDDDTDPPPAAPAARPWPRVFPGL